MGMEIDLSSLSEKLKANEEYNIKKEELISDIVNKRLTFVSVIEALSEVLTNQDVATRERGIDFLSWILSEIPPDLFNSAEIAAVVNFYTDRLKDHHSIAPATIKGLLAIVKMNNIEKESIKQFLVPLFQDINCQTQLQSDRYNIFSIVAYIVENHLDIVAAMGSDFVFAIISLADGETDPSNLMLLFQFLPLFLKNIDLGHLMEEMFDLLSCYFPVDFNPAAKNISITREDLAEGLMNCLSAKPDFADHCLPLILEKLSSTLKTARIDSYKLLGACCATYTVENVNKHSSEIWKIIQKDVLPVVDNQICEAALYALSEIVRLFSSSEPEQHILKNFLDDILTSIRTLLNNTEDSLFSPAMSVLLAVASKSTVAARYVLRYLKFVFGSDAAKNQSQRKIILFLLKPFLPVVKACSLAQSSAEEELSLFNGLSQFYLDCVSSNNREVQELAYSGIQELVTDFSEEFRSELLTIVARCIKAEGNIDIREESLKILRLLGGITPDEVLQLLKNFQISMNSSLSDCHGFILAICAVADVGSITYYAVPQVLDIITNSHHYDIALSGFLKSCKMVEADTNDFLKKLHRDYCVTERLIKWWIEGKEKRVQRGEAAIEDLSQIIAFIVRHQESSDQQSIVNEFVPVLLSETHRSEQEGSELNVIVLEAILGSLRPNVKLDSFHSLSADLVTLAVRSSNVLIRTSSSRLLASIVNKADHSQSQMVDVVFGMVFHALNDSSAISERLNAASLLSWLVKGLLLGNSQRLESIISKWFDLLEREDVGGRIAEGFHTVLLEESMYLNMKSHCNVKILYRQRFFTYFPKLMQKFLSAEQTIKPNYLLALTRLVEGVPNYVTVTELGNVVLIMVQALNSKTEEVIIAALVILHDFLRAKEPLLVDYAQSLVTKFLSLARYEGSMKIRIIALKCLYWFGFYPTVTILPLKKEVVRSLEPCLDDRKRLVRSEAVRARSRWYLVGAPGEDTIFS